MGNQQIKKLASFTESLVILPPFTSGSGYHTEWFIRHAHTHTHTHTHAPSLNHLPQTFRTSVSLFMGCSTQNFENDTFPNKDSIPQTNKHMSQLSSTEPLCKSSMCVTLTVVFTGRSWTQNREEAILGRNLRPSTWAANSQSWLEC